MELQNQKGFYIVEKVNGQLSSERELTIRQTENAFYTQILKLAEKVSQKRIVLLSGPSSSGKTTTAQKLFREIVRQRRPAVAVSLDDFYKNRSELPVVDGRPNAEVVDALQIDLIVQTLMQLDKTGEAELPVFDFTKGVRQDHAKKVELPQDGIVIVEGLHALNDRISEGLPVNDLYKVYVSPHSGFTYGDRVWLSKRQVRCLRRIVRDSWARDCDAERTLSLWGDVCAGEDLYIRPFQKFADCRIDTTHAYECGLLRAQAEKVLSVVTADSAHYETAQDLLRRIRVFDYVEASQIPKDSLLHEFIG